MTRNNLETGWQVFANADAVAEAALAVVLQAADKAIKQKAGFKFVLAGGTTPEKVYRLLATQDCDWQHWHVFIGDERCLPADDPERNSMIAKVNFLDKVAIPDTQIHFFPAEQGAEAAAMAYAQVVADKLPFDLVMLGVGEDGHTASLFPGHVHPQNEFTHPVHNSPKPPSDRVTLSQHTLSQAQQVLILATGSNKREVIQQWRAGVALPVAKVSALQERLVFLDKGANDDET